ncbi:MAG: M20/M25/M40 family metallo-hydrolase [Gammaproteobacteria bacterium]|nr:M20/M25/M40 family metallo-hydrolase [Gammaproteobacteria bacterium]
MDAFYRSFLVLFLLFGAELVTADLTELENRIIAIAERDKEAAIALLARTVNINSGTMNHLGVKAVGDIFAEEFQSLGLTTTWHDMSEVNRAGHLFAETAGESGSRCLLLIGHLDTVFEPDSPFQTFDRQGDQATGPGVNDMKGGDVVILYALKALKEVGVLDDLNLIVALIGDEEKSGSPKSISRYHLIEASKRCDIALGFEIATSLNAATVARRGSSGWRLDVSGKRAHSAGIFNDEVGSGAIFEAARILNQFHEQLTGEEYLTFNPGVILGGTDVDYDPSRNKGGTFGKTNVVAQSVVVHGGLRTISPAQEASARARMKAIAENNHLPKTSAQITFQDGYPSMPPTEGNMAVLANLSGVSVDLDQGEVVAFDPGKRGAADVSFVAGYVDVIDGVGAEGNGAHTLDESIDLATLPLLIQRAAILIHRLSTVEHY